MDNLNVILYDNGLPENFNNLGNSVFLAGPTNRKGRTKWREDAIKLFTAKNFKGTLFVPEFFNEFENSTLDKEEIIDWELACLNNATMILFWIPRSDELPAFTTNVEFGMYHKQENVRVGSPKLAPKMVYLRTLWYLQNPKAKFGTAPWCDSLEEVVDAVIKQIESDNFDAATTSFGH